MTKLQAVLVCVGAAKTIRLKLQHDIFHFRFGLLTGTARCAAQRWFAWGAALADTVNSRKEEDGA